MSDEDKKKYLEFAKQLALEAGDIMLRYFLVTKRTWKSDDTPLTQADTEINRLVIERINVAYPDHSILGEEESLRKDSPYTWVCDPVDGTMPYSHGLPISSFSLALCVDGVPQVGVVCDPFMKRLFYGTVGGGAFCNGEKLHVNDSGMENALIYVGAFPSPKKEVVHTEFRVQKAVQEKGANTVELWSTVLPTCLLAQGMFTGALLNISEAQDGAAIKVIVEEAGGRVTDLFGDEQCYDQPTKGFIASNSVIHDELVKLVREAVK